MPLLDVNKTNFKIMFSPNEEYLERNFAKILHKNGFDHTMIDSKVKFDSNKIPYYLFNASLENALAVKKILKGKYNFQTTDKYKKFVKELYNDEIIFREQRKEVKRIKALDPSKIMTVKNGRYFIDDYEFKTEPWDHQKIGFLLFKYLKSLMLNWDMRTGKTYSVVNAMQYFKLFTKLKKTLVICPSGIMQSTWIRDCYKHTDLEGYAAVQSLNKQRIKALSRGNITMPLPDGTFKEFPGEPDYWVLNHDSISNSEILKFVLTELQPDNFVIDEYHNFKTTTTNRTKAALKIANYIHNKNGAVISMSGTPIARDVRDVYAPCTITDHRIFNYSFTEFKKQFCIFDIYKIYSGEKNKEKLKKRYLVRTHRVLIQEVHDMPEKIESIRYIELSPEQKKHHKDLKNELKMDLPEGKGVLTCTSLSKLQKLVQITGGYVYTKKDKEGNKEVLYLKKNTKLEELDNLLKQILSNEKNNVVLLTNYLPSVNILKKYLDSSSWEYENLTTINDKFKERHLSVFDFQNKKEKRVILAQPRLCPGHDMSKANYVIFYDNTYQYVDRDQGETRIYTHTSKEHGTVVTIDLICKNSIDELLHKVLMKKRNLNQEITEEDIRGFFQ